MQVILMQLVYQITWLVIPNCDLNMTICHPYLFRFDRFISKYFLDDAYDTFDDVILSCCEIEISFRAFNLHRIKKIFWSIRFYIFASIENSIWMHNSHENHENGLFFLNDFNLTGWHVESELRSKVILSQIVFLKLEKCMWRVKQGQTYLRYHVLEAIQGHPRLISKSPWEILRVPWKNSLRAHPLWLKIVELHLKSEIFQLSRIGNWSNNGF